MSPRKLDPDEIINDPANLTRGATIETPSDASDPDAGDRGSRQGEPDPDPTPVRRPSTAEPLTETVTTPAAPQPEPTAEPANPRRARQSEPPVGEAMIGVASPVIATPDENAALQHSDPSGGATTRDDNLDAGVPMLPGSPDEPQGPEDALGVGPKRGDYSTRVGPSGYQPHTTVRGADGIVRLVPQRPNVEQRGDVPGVKGGVETDPSHPANRVAAGSRVAPSTDETTTPAE
jgi:hypothetical protein